MIIGVPKEIKEQEQRVALLPSAADQLKRRGHSVLVEKNAGVGSGYSDDEYKKAGAEIVDSADEVFKRGELIVKVKEPLPAEFPLLRKNQILFTYLHLAASKPLTEALLKSGVTGIAYETIQVNGRLPLLEPMSEVAGRMSVVMGANFLAKHNGGSGVLLGGVPGVLPGRVVVIGGGTSGVNALRMAKGLGADVTILDIDVERLRFLDLAMEDLHTLYSSEANLDYLMPDCDLLIGAVLLPGAKAPKLITRAMLRRMKPGSVFVDIAIDQGGCAETSRPTTHRRSRLCRRRCDPLLRGQHAGGLRTHFNAGAHERHLSLCATAGRLRSKRSVLKATDAHWRNQHPRWQADLPGRCRRARFEIRTAVLKAIDTTAERACSES